MYVNIVELPWYSIHSQSHVVCIAHWLPSKHCIILSVCHFCWHTSLRPPIGTSVWFLRRIYIARYCYKRTTLLATNCTPQASHSIPTIHNRTIQLNLIFPNVKTVILQKYALHCARTINEKKNVGGVESGWYLRPRKMVLGIDLRPRHDGDGCGHTYVTPLYMWL